MCRDMDGQSHNVEQLKQIFTHITVWKRGAERAPHKPLLLLYALGKCQRGESRAIPYAEVDPALQRLLRTFGPPRKSYHSEYPFWRLQQDGIWELHGAEHIIPRQSNNDAKKSELMRYEVSGGFPAPIYTVLRDHPRMLVKIASDLLERNFPESIHEDIADAVGLNLQVETITRATRDPHFRVRILTVYGYTCAICGFDVRLGETALGVEAAHIKWYQAGGPSIETNGLALCILHHKHFDRGAFTIALNRQVQVSEYAHGATGFTEWLLAYHGKPIRPPQSPQYLPKEEYLHWHMQQVFRGPARHLVGEDASSKGGD
jgi:putative restriction endonuclease